MPLDGVDPVQLAAALNANPQLTIELHMIRPPGVDGGKAYFYADAPGPWSPDDSVVLSIPEKLWAMLGRRADITARLTIEKDLALMPRSASSALRSRSG